MSTDSPNPIGDIAVDQNNLYREETFTDLRVGSIQRLTPVRLDGTDDPTRETLYVGQTQIMSNAGPLPIQARFEAGNLEQAIEAFPAAMQEAVERMVEQAREMQRQEMNRIVVPGERPGPKIIT